MMQKILQLLIIILLSSTFGYSQGSFIDMMKMLGGKNEIPKGIVEVKQVTYKTFLFQPEGEEPAQPDTTINFQGKDYPLFYNGHTIVDYSEPGIQKSTVYMPSGNKSFVSTAVYNEKEQIISEENEFADAAMAMMNSSKQFTYDEEGRLASVIEGGAELMKIKYRKGFIIESLDMDAGMMKMSTSAKEFGDTTRYEMSADLGPLKSMMGGKGMPREYTDLLVKDDIYHFTTYQEDRESGKMNEAYKCTYSEDLDILEEHVKNYEGLQHFVYAYNDEGNMVSKTNKTNGEVITWEYDDKGRATKTYEENQYIYHIYDAQGNSVLDATVDNYGDHKLNTAVINTYTYKK